MIPEEYFKQIAKMLNDVGINKNTVDDFGGMDDIVWNPDMIKEYPELITYNTRYVGSALGENWMLEVQDDLPDAYIEKCLRSSKYGSFDKFISVLEDFYNKAFYGYGLDLSQYTDYDDLYYDTLNNRDVKWLVCNFIWGTYFPEFAESMGVNYQGYAPLSTAERLEKLI